MPRLSLQSYRSGVWVVCSMESNTASESVVVILSGWAGGRIRTLEGRSSMKFYEVLLRALKKGVQACVIVKEKCEILRDSWNRVLRAADWVRVKTKIEVERPWSHKSWQSLWNAHAMCLGFQTSHMHNHSYYQPPSLIVLARPYALHSRSVIHIIPRLTMTFLPTHTYRQWSEASHIAS